MRESEFLKLPHYCAITTEKIFRQIKSLIRTFVAYTKFLSKGPGLATVVTVFFTNVNFLKKKLISRNIFKKL